MPQPMTWDMVIPVTPSSLSRCLSSSNLLSLQMMESRYMPESAITPSEGTAPMPAAAAAPGLTGAPLLSTTLTAAAIWVSEALSYSPSPRSVFSLTSMSMLVTSLMAKPE